MPNRFLRLPEVKLRVGLSRSSIYNRIAQGTFVTPIRLGPHSIAWREEDIDRWMAERAPARGEDSADLPPEPPTGTHEAALQPERRVNVAVGLSARVRKRGFAAERAKPLALTGARDGRR